MNELANKKPTMSAILASNSIKELGSSLTLTPAQINKAKSSALALSSNQSLAKCDPFSLVKFCFETARYNFGRDDCVYPVPYFDYKTNTTKVQAQMSYRGFRELAYRSGLYKEISASVVYDGDKVTRDRETGEITVEFNDDPATMDTGKVLGFFAFAKDNDGKLSSTVYMSKQAMDKHRDRYSKSKDKDGKLSGPWKDQYEKMALKTVIKQLCGTISTSPLMQDAIKFDQAVMGSQGESDKYLDNPIAFPNEEAPAKREAVSAPQIEIELSDYDPLTGAFDDGDAQ